MFVHLSLHESTTVIGVPSPEMKKKFTLCCQIINSWKVLYGRYPWIQLALECQSMLEKGINFIFCFGTAYDISSMESVGNSKSFSLVGKVCLRKCFYLSIFALSSGTSTNPYFPLRRVFLLLYAIFFNLSLHLLL